MNGEHNIMLRQIQTSEKMLKLATRSEAHEGLVWAVGRVWHDWSRRHCKGGYLRTAALGV